MFCSVTERYLASNSKHVLFGAKHVVYRQPWLILQFSGRKVKNKTNPGINQKVHLLGLFTK